MTNADQIAPEGLFVRGVDEVQPSVAAVHSKVTDLEQQARTFIRQRPVVAVLAAAGVGFLVARAVSRVMR